MLVCASNAASAFAQEKVNLADLLEKVEPAVLRLDVTGKEGKSIGSGFVIDASGIAITNVHVVANATKAIAKFEDGRAFEVEGVLGFDPSRDIAIIKLADAKNLPFLKLQEK
ncbi:MAG TPA: trypsin-like peptidase domain-containing protein, partial [Planctomycetaceae bacterium]|nr:trypsin-like peptidase domain-containing protein [Planctomycetaceae bacterium]